MLMEMIAPRYLTIDPSLNRLRAGTEDSDLRHGIAIEFLSEVGGA